MEEEYEVPNAPHERAIEEASEHGENRLGQRIALMTAILATLGALISYQSGSAQNEAMFLKNESILRQAEASDQWAFYQSKSTKAHVAEATADLATDPQIKARYAAQARKETADKETVRAKAEALEAESRQLGLQSEARLRPHERLAAALTFIQIAVALAAITVLTRRRWLFWGSAAFALGGVGTAASALLMH